MSATRSKDLPAVQEQNQKTYTLRDLAHAFGLRYASPIYCLTHLTAAFLVPSLSTMNILQQGAYYIWFMYPSMTHVAGVGAYYVTPQHGPKLTLRSIIGRVVVSTLFATSVVAIGLSVTNRIQLPFVNEVAHFGSQLVPSWIGSIASRVSEFATEELSEKSRQFIKFNFFSVVSYGLCFISLGHWLRAIPDIIRVQWQKVVASAIEIAKQRKE